MSNDRPSLKVHSQVLKPQNRVSVEDQNELFISEDEDTPQEEVNGSEDDDEFTDSEHSQGVGKSFL